MGNGQWATENGKWEIGNGNGGRALNADDVTYLWPIAHCPSAPATYEVPRSSRYLRRYAPNPGNRPAMGADPRARQGAARADAAAAGGSRQVLDAHRPARSRGAAARRVSPLRREGGRQREVEADRQPAEGSRHRVPADRAVRALL